MVHCLSAGGVGYLAVLHAQLFDQQPALAFLPLFVIGLIAHFLIRARSTDTSKTEAARAGQVRPLLQRDEDARGGAAASPGSPTSASPNRHDHLDLDRDDDDNNQDSSSVYSSPLEDEDDDIYEISEESELDPSLFLEVQHDDHIQEEDSNSHRIEEEDHLYANVPQFPFGMQNSQRSDSLEVVGRTVPADNLYPDLCDDGAWQSSGPSSDYNTLSDIELQEDDDK